jgi:hypothetical protein
MNTKYQTHVDKRIMEIRERERLFRQRKKSRKF